MIQTPILTFTTALTLSLTSASAGTTKIYLGTQGRGESKGIYLCDLNTETGALSKPKLAATLSGCGFLAIHPNKKYLYSTARGDGNQVAAFHIKDDYTLDPINLQEYLAKEIDGELCQANLETTALQLSTTLMERQQKETPVTLNSLLSSWLLQE